jgi:hypothetical protein
MDEILVKAALDMLRSNPRYAADARAGAPVGNSVIGSLLSIEYRAPRWATERAVRQALAILDDEADDEADEEVDSSLTYR